jgi:hypothetical protein
MCNFTAAELALNNLMVEVWTCICTTGHPAHNGVRPASTATDHEAITIDESAVAGSLNILSITD